MELVSEVVARTAGAGAKAVAALDHESIDDAVKGDAIVVRAAAGLTRRRILPRLRPFSQPDEVRHGVRRLFLEQTDRERPFRRIEQCVCTGFHVALL